MLTERQLKRAATDLPWFLEQFCHVLHKDDSTLLKFKMNKGQMFVHEKLEKQLRETGRVRALILKPRQQGMSTFCAARMTHNLMFNMRRTGLVIAHNQEAVRSFKDQTYMSLLEEMKFPGKNMRNMFDDDSADYKRFADSKSILRVGWATGKQGFRGTKAHYVHATEAAYYDLADKEGGEKLITAILQSMPPNTGEIILESTSYGPQGKFYEMWQKSPENGFIQIFVPWWWNEEYRMPLPPNFELDTLAPEGGLSEVEYKETYGLDDEQIMFLREKRNNSKTFYQEFPATASEAWANISSGSFIPASAIYRGLQRGRHRTNRGTPPRLETLGSGTAYRRAYQNG